MKSSGYIGIFLLALFVQASVFAQNTSIKLVNSKTSEAIPYARVALYKPS